jgi:heavy metal sensor kinase
MTLTIRVCGFFLGTLALVLAGFSGSLYVLADAHLHRQAGVRLEAALEVLVAAAEAEPGGLEWELSSRHQVIATDDGVCWVVTDGGGQWVDGSADSEAARFFGAVDASAAEVSYREQPWRLARRRLEASPPAAAASGGPGPKRYAALIVTAAVPLGPVDAALRRLALLLTGLSLVLWLSAALVGWRLCRRALRPLTQMAQAARGITAADLGRRLPAAGTGDELEDLGRAFNDLLGRLQESFERQRRFTGDASHQLRTPLTALLGQIDVALRRPRDPEEYRRVLHAVQGQAGNLRRIVEALLFLARADAEALAPELARMDLRQWLAGHLASWSSHPRFADLRQEPGDGTPLGVRAHAPLLAQALDNLLENACKYSASGSPITVRTWQEAGVVRLAVEDQGCGIDAADLPHVFEPFYRSVGNRRPGVGLGLAVAARIARALGGQVAAASGPGKGSTFRIELPVDPP